MYSRFEAPTFKEVTFFGSFHCNCNLVYLFFFSIYTQYIYNKENFFNSVYSRCTSARKVIQLRHRQWIFQSFAFSATEMRFAGLDQLFMRDIL